MFRAVGLCLAATLTLAHTTFAATITVNAGGDLQAAIDAAKPGDTIVLQAGATFTGPFRLRAKGGTSFITIQSTPSTGLPLAGVRISPLAAPLLAKIKSSTAGSAMRTDAGATYWRLRPLQFFPGSPTSRPNPVGVGGGGLGPENVVSRPPPPR